MLIRNAKVFIDGCYQDVDVRCLDGLISAVGKNLSDSESIDAKGMYLFAGMIDTHIHGAKYCDYSGGSQAVKTIAAALPEYGVTSFFATPIVRDIESTQQTMRGIRAAKGCPGADILGIFPYMPYRNRSIAYYPDHVPPTKEHTLAVCDNDLSDVRMIYCAPELPGAMEWISWLSSQGVVPMAAYTEGTTEQMYEAADRGARIVDHFYNGLPLLDHHTNGSTVGLLLDKRYYLQMTCDGIHVAKPFIDLAIRCKGVEKIIPVSDSSKYVGMPEGTYTEGGRTVIVKDGAVRDPNGKLVTGAHSYDDNMRTMKRLGYSMEDIGTMFSENAARCFNLKDRGKIEAGRRADLVIMDAELRVIQTFVKGQSLFKAQSID
jgi:N-acetylglucosamine-6-phosphate deacetylase